MILKKIDSIILSVYQKFSDVSYSLIEKNNFYLARLSVIFFVIFNIISDFAQYLYREEESFTIFVFGVVSLCVFIPFLNRMISIIELNLFNEKDRIKHPFRVRLLILLVYFILPCFNYFLIEHDTNILIVIKFISKRIGSFLFVSILYFASCKPKY